ncbi:MAG: phosphotransferase family protein [Desulfobacterales bacterium]|jgi:aminoglycoside phosphotransferase (APT) family kinase protein|nr:phosphotransferase family protein [Desulfobacterales bacterium]
MLNADKNNPSDEVIEAIRQRFPVEAEIDRILSRKMRQRPGVPYLPVSLKTLENGVEALIGSNHDGRFDISDVRWLSGGASKLQMAFTLAWNNPATGRTKTPMVLRMEPMESVAETSRLREFQLIKAFEGIVPVPPVYWVDSDAVFLPYPGMIYGFVEGVTKPSCGVSNVSGAGMNVGARLRKQLAPQFIEHLSIIHTFDFTKSNLTAFNIPKPGTQAAEWAVNWWERVWEEDAGEDVPLMRYANAWLRDNLPTVDRLSIVHSDYRIGNCLFNEQEGRITAWLDWELGHIGDRHEDLAWATISALGHLAEDGKTFLCTGLMPEEEILTAYEKTSGLTVDRKALHFYKVLVTYKLVVLCLGTGYRVVRGGKTHQDVLITWLMGIGPAVLNDLYLLLDKGV